MGKYLDATGLSHFISKIKMTFQEKLVSGTNIKTINNTSLLGSGNIAVQPTLVSGTNIKTINNGSLLGSGNISLPTASDIPTKTSDLTNDSGYITTDTKNTTGSTDSNSKLYLIGATEQSANPQTYSNSKVYATNGALSASSFNGIQMGVGNNYSISIGAGQSGIIITGSYTLNAACAKAVDTSISSGSTSTNLPTTAAVVNYIAGMTTGVSMEDTDVDDAVNAAWSGVGISVASGVSF